MQSGAERSAFGEQHAVAVLAAAVLGLVLRASWPPFAAGVLSLGWFAFGQRGAYTPGGGFGVANGVTLLRLLLLGVLAVPGTRLPGPYAAALVLALLALDGVDGFLARRHGLASAFGARFDVECDALLVLCACLWLFQAHRLPAFILVPGFLRYLYVIALAWLPGARREQPRSRFGRAVFALFVLSLVASLWPLPGHRPLALVATLLICVSFARSVVWSYKAV